MKRREKALQTVCERIMRGTRKRIACTGDGIPENRDLSRRGFQGGFLEEVEQLGKSALTINLRDTSSDGKSAGKVPDESGRRRPH